MYVSHMINDNVGVAVEGEGERIWRAGPSGYVGPNYELAKSTKKPTPPTEPNINKTLAASVQAVVVTLH